MLEALVPEIILTEEQSMSQSVSPEEIEQHRIQQEPTQESLMPNIMPAEDEMQLDDFDRFIQNINMDDIVPINVNPQIFAVEDNDNYIEEETLLDSTDAIRFAPGMQ